ncbi:50S ribosomal protein L4 [Spiroplasma endosymbiont of Anurida maritima]|uniref:50S ribosomal protein L4 n=1 Tax=Spiroplasma endosymbiont of Anurida maritima TaxID=2967972 RepID=UPI0036D24B1A
MKFKVHDITGNAVKDITLDDNIWNIKPHNQAMFDTVIAQQAAMRQGTHKVKSKGDVSGGGRKPWRQKGTGRARHGSIRSPQWRGGGVVFGPNTDRNYKKHVNKKVRQLAIKSVLSDKVLTNDLIIIDKFGFEAPSTKDFINALTNLKIKDEKILVITNEEDIVTYKSSRNVERVNIIAGRVTNAYDVMNANKLLITEDAVKALEEVYS